MFYVMCSKTEVQKKFRCRKGSKANGAAAGLLLGGCWGCGWGLKLIIART